MTGQEFARFQAATMAHLSFSLTLACPLRCAHCMVATVSPRDADSASLPVTVARRFAAEMPAVAAMGISRISFTGGEPFVAREQLSILSDAAARAGIGCTVVTACHWAKTPSIAARTIAAFPALDRWHVSTDVFHSDQLDPVFVVNAARALCDAGREVQIRMAVPADPGGDEAALLDWLRQRLPAGVGFAVQPVMGGPDPGCADPACPDPACTDGAAPPSTPCLTTGPLIRHDGQLSPCCSGLAERLSISPFDRADPARTGLVEAIGIWRGDRLLTLIRALGFGYPALWAAEAGAPTPAAAPRHPCDYCTALWAAPATRAAVLDRIASPEVAARIDALARTLFPQSGVAA